MSPIYIIEPRDDVAPSQRCFVVRNVEREVIGYVQEYADGTAAWWREPMQKATPAKTLDDAARALLEGK